MTNDYDDIVIEHARKIIFMTSSHPLRHLLNGDGYWLDRTSHAASFDIDGYLEDGVTNCKDNDQECTCGRRNNVENEVSHDSANQPDHCEVHLLDGLLGKLKERS